MPSPIKARCCNIYPVNFLSTKLFFNNKKGVLTCIQRAFHSLPSPLTTKQSIRTFVARHSSAKLFHNNEKGYSDIQPKNCSSSTFTKSTTCETECTQRGRYELESQVYSALTPPRPPRRRFSRFVLLNLRFFSSIRLFPPVFWPLFALLVCFSASPSCIYGLFLCPFCARCPRLVLLVDSLLCRVQSKSLHSRNLFTLVSSTLYYFVLVL